MSKLGFTNTQKSIGAMYNGSVRLRHNDPDCADTQILYVPQSDAFGSVIVNVDDALAPFGLTLEGFGINVKLVSSDPTVIDTGSDHPQIACTPIELLADQPDPCCSLKDCGDADMV